LPLDRADVVESRFDLDDDERLTSRLERQQIDPSVGTAGERLDLARSQPAGSPESAIDVRRAASMNEVATPGLDDDGWPSDQFEVDPQPLGDPPYEIERRIGGSALDPRIVRTRYPDGRGHISLREVEGRPRVPAEASERDAER
jgi:hypothetical protein